MLEKGAAPTMVRIRVLDVDGDAADVQAVLDRLRGVVAARADRADGAVDDALQLTPGATAPGGLGESNAEAIIPGDIPPGPGETPESSPARSSPPAASAPAAAAATDIEELSLADDVGVRFESGPPATIRIHRKGRGRHMHEFVVPDEASAPPAHPVAASCAHELRGAPCPERRTFRLV